MIRGQFQIFSCRSAEHYSDKIVHQLQELVEARSKELFDQGELSLHEQDELQFVLNLREDGARIGKSTIVHFDDGEMNVLIDEAENVRDKDVFLVQCPYNTINGLTVSENIMETFIFLDALRRAKAQSVTLISLYYPFGRGDKQHAKDGVPAKMLASLLTNAGMNNILTMDLHADQITGFFNSRETRIEHLHASPLHIKYIQEFVGTDDLSIMAPDTGAAKRAQFFAQNLQAKMVMSYKRRSYQKKHVVDELKILGLPEKNVIIVDDIVSSGGSVIKVMEKLTEHNVENIYIACTHPLMTGKCIENLDKLYNDPKHPFKGLIGTDAIPHNGEVKNKEWYAEIDTSRFVAKAVYEMHTSGSVSMLHDPFCVDKHDLWIHKKQDD